MSEIALSEIKIGKRFRKDLGNIKKLAKSIEEIGLLHPIVIDDEKNLIAGYRRIKAFEHLDREKIPYTRLSLKDLKQGEVKENIERKNFTHSEMVEIKNHFQPIIAKKALNRKKSTQIKKGKPPSGPSESDEPRGRTDDTIAELCGTSRDTLRKAEAVVNAAKENPEEFGKTLKKLDKGKITLNYAHDKVKRSHKHSAPPPLPEGEFDVIYADPPWHYDIKSRGAENHYPVIDELELTKLEIPTAKDAVLFLWATNAKLNTALTVMTSWGFKYKTNMAWVKNRIGTGFYVRGKHELLLIGKRGEVPLPMESTRPHSVLQADVQKHSKKPEIVYEIIESMYPNRQYLELFARNTRKGWVSWGDEI